MPGPLENEVKNVLLLDVINK